jgi:serine O-acetyltransferase
LAAYPVLGDNVDLGAGSRILGGIYVGSRVIVGANAVVIADVPDDSTVVGVPARIINYSRSADRHKIIEDMGIS